ncbi:hypothetical protein Tco_0838097 [Tanacetum coccineum]|uniref:Uncharacterized protein n=1 Tax=Tanacetum coccineum TaxID=301880 RepID=A0ABQ5ALT0_9ASTR
MDEVCSICCVKAGNSFVNDPNLNSSNDSPNFFNHPLQPQMYSCELCGNDSHHGYDCPPRFPLLNKYIQEKQEEKNNVEEQAAKVSSQYLKPPIYYDDDDDDEESSIPLRDIISELPLSISITPVLPTKEPDDFLSMGDEHLSTISETESNEVIKSSVEDLMDVITAYEVSY